MSWEALVVLLAAVAAAAAASSSSGPGIGTTVFVDNRGKGAKEGEEKAYQTKCLPLGIGRTQVTAPLPAGNLRVLSGCHAPRA